MLKTASLTRRAILFLALAPAFARADKAMPGVTLTGQKGQVTALAFSPDGKQLASASDDGVLKIWDLATDKELFSFDDITTSKNQIRWTPDGKKIVTMGRENNIVVLDADAGKVATRIAMTGLDGGPEAIDLSFDGKTIAVVGRGNLRLYDVTGGDPKYAWEVHKLYAVPSVAFSHDGNLIATTGTDDTALVLEPTTGKIIQTLKLDLKGDQILFNPDGKKLLVYSTDQVLNEFDIESGQSRKLVDKGVTLDTISWSPDGKKLALGGVGRAPWLLSVADGTVVQDAYDSEDLVKSAAVSPDGKWLAGGANEGSIFLWKIAE